MPSLAVEPLAHDDNTVAVPLGGSSRIHRRIGIVWHRDRYRSPAAKGFVAIAQAVVDAGL